MCWVVSQHPVLEKRDFHENENKVFDMSFCTNKESMADMSTLMCTL